MRQVSFQEFPGPGKLENHIPGVSRSCTNPVEKFVWNPIKLR
jgi:hypothetical protein